MFRLTWPAAILVCAHLFSAGCGDSTPAAPDHGATKKDAQSGDVNHGGNDLQGTDAGQDVVTSGNDVVISHPDVVSGADFPDLGEPISAIAMPCTTHTQCGASGRCLVASVYGVAGGYCTHDCDPADPTTCPEPNTLCAAVPAIGAPFCVLTCTGMDSDCSQGYVCDSQLGAAMLPGGATVCLPASRTAKIGDACAGFNDCPVGAFCEQSPFLPGNYCSQACTVGMAGSCPTDAECVRNLAPGAPANSGTCAAKCDAAASNCRMGYACVAEFANVPLTTTVCAPGVATAVPGDPCVLDSDCTAGRGFCLKEANSLVPGGYCSEPCDLATSGACGAGSECVAGGPFNPTGGICVKSCAAPTDCRTDYQCVSGFLGQTSVGTVCAPGQATVADGDPCTDDSDCQAGDGFCIGLASGIPGGYCTRLCQTANAGECGTGECIHFAGQLAGNGLCLKSCTGAADCRAGFSCAQNYEGLPTVGTVCAPGNTTAGPLGRPCADAGECTGGPQFCLNDPSRMGAFPGGYCSQSCDSTVPTSCPAGDVCIPQGQAPDPTLGVCLAGCQQDSDCAALRGSGANAGSYGCGQPLGGPPGSKTCLPFNPTAKTGDACINLNDCQLGGACIGPPANPGFRGGYCTLGCNPSVTTTGCDAGDLCVPTNPQNATEGLCVKGCSSSPDCRVDEGYSCHPNFGLTQKFCSP